MTRTLESHRVSSLAHDIWGKTDDMKRADERNGEWLPLVVHLDDTASVGLSLFESLGRLGQDAIGHGLDHRQSRERFVALCAVHDIGKATPSFLTTPTGRKSPVVARRKAALEAGGLTFPAEVARNEVRHEAAALAILLRRFGIRAESAASVVTAHHGYALPENEQNRLREAAEDGRYRALGWGVGLGPWWEVQGEILDSALQSAARVLGSSVESVAESLLTSMPHWAQIAASGAVVRADHLASDEMFFPLSGRAAGIPRIPSLRPVAESPSLSSIYSDRFGYASPTSLQQRLVERIGRIERPGIVIVESGMGSGKTEAALAAAEVLAAKFGASGVAFAMPTMATSDTMHGRVRKWASKLPGFDGSVVFLGHSSSALSEVNHADRKRLTRSQQQAARHIGTGHAVSVSTIDQIAKMGVRSKAAYLSRAKMLGKVVIFDEVHTYDEYTTAFLLRTLEHLAAQRTPVIVLSATLSTDRRRELVQSYVRAARLSPFSEERPSADVFEVADTDEYPLITVGDHLQQAAEMIRPESSEASRQVEVRVNEGGDAQFVADLIRQQTPLGGCVGVIRSTVASAQQTARSLTTEFPDDRVILLHSRFTVGHRARHLDTILKAVGKDGTQRPVDGSRVIVVATQVIEESVDVDFDYLVSDIAPLDSILQRIGRLHRHDRDGRPVRSARCDVVNVRQSGRMMLATKGSKIDLIYSPYQLHSSATWLSNRAEISLPEDIRSAVRAMRAAPEDGFEQLHLEWVGKEQRKREDAVSSTLEPIRYDREHRFGEHVEAECNVKLPGADTTMHGGSIRDADGSVEGVLTSWSPEGRRTQDGVLIPGTDTDTSEEIAREIALSSIRLPRSKHLSPSLFAVPPAWKGRCPAVLHGSLELRLAPTPHTPTDQLLHVGPLAYSYSETYGLEQQ